LKKSFTETAAAAPVDEAVLKQMQDAETEDTPSSLPILANPAAIGQVTAPSAQVRLPQLKIRNSNSTCSLGTNEMPLGTITLDNEYVVSDPKGRATLILLGYEAYFEDNVDIGAEKKIYKSLEEIVASGKAPDLAAARVLLNRGPNGEKSVLRDAARAPVLVEKPADFGPSRAFPFEFEGKFYALARWYLSGWAVWGPGRTILNKSQLELRPVGLLAAKWEMTTEKADGRAGPFWKPHLRLLEGNNSPAFQTWMRNLAAGTA